MKPITNRLTIGRNDRSGIKKGLRTNQQAFKVLSSVLTTPLIQISQESSSFRHFRIVPKLVLQASTIWYQRNRTVQPDTLRVDWFSCARISRKQLYADALETGAEGKTDLVDTIGAWPSYQDGERFLTMNLRINTVRHGAREYKSRLPD